MSGSDSPRLGSVAPTQESSDDELLLRSDRSTRESSVASSTHESSVASQADSDSEQERKRITALARAAYRALFNLPDDDKWCILVCPKYRSCYKLPFHTPTQFVVFLRQVLRVRFLDPTYSA